MLKFRQAYYGGRAYADALARQGYVVVAHDVFLWGSRKFPLDAMSSAERALADPAGAMFGQILGEGEVRHYNGAASLHEHVVGKYCNVLGTSFTAIAKIPFRRNFSRAVSSELSGSAANPTTVADGTAAATVLITSGFGTSSSIRVSSVRRSFPLWTAAGR